MAEARLKTDLRDRVGEAETPHSHVVSFGPDQPLKLDAGVELSPLQIAYQTYGTLNAARSNAVLICHALTGDQHVANLHPVTGKPGWWETMVGPGKPIDTDRYFAICPNVVGACMGTTGPASINAKTGRPYGLEFPVVTVRDIVRAQAMLLDHLGIDSLFAVAGGSMGGMQVLQWAASYPDRVFAALPIACATRHSAQNIAFHEVGRQAVMLTGAAAAIWRKAPIRAAGSPLPAWPRTSPIFRTRRCIANSAAASRIASIRPSRSMPISRLRAICATRAVRSFSASMPTAT
jgi:homoserine O-acetyltransferase